MQQTWKRDYSLQCRFEFSRIVDETFLAVNQLTIYHAVAIWCNRVQKMRHGERDFELNKSVHDVTTLEQHGVLDQDEEATR